jgi:hypothetical protein
MSPSQALGIGPVVSPAKHGVLLRGLMKPSTQQKKVAVPVLATEAAEMFKKLFKRGPWPDKADCYRLAIDITAVKCAPPQAAKYADKNFADRLATFKAMKKLAHKQLKKARERSLGGLRLPELVYMEAFNELLDVVRDGLLYPYDSLAGERVGSEWHKPARYIAVSVEKAMRSAGHESISRDKGSRFVRAICGALELAGQGTCEPSAVAAVLAKPPL